MLAKVISGTCVGLDGVLIDVEVDIAERGFPTLTIVGLPNKSVDEAKDRVRTAIINASYEMPDSRMTINLAPADLPKQGSSFDLPIAVGILTAAGLIERDSVTNSLFIGELSLEGKVRRVPGILSIALAAKKQRIDNLYIPVGNLKEASLIEDITIYPISNLVDLILHLNKEKILSPSRLQVFDDSIIFQSQMTDFKEVRGQQTAKRALEIAASGFHNIHLTGPPGTGKTLLSRAFPSILPPMEKEEIIQVSQIYSIMGMLHNDNFIVNRPFRSPHHTTSRIGLVGGGSNPLPGEISLAHRGVLFLDEFPEFPRSTLESLRQPLEDGMVTISRASGSVTFPSRFQLLAASNPCPCGYLGHPKKQCKCLPGMVLRYRKRLSGPLLDRIDLHVTVLPVEQEKLLEYAMPEGSEQVRSRVIEARERQKRRFSNKRIKTNGEMSPQDIREHCHLKQDSIEFLKQAIAKLSLSARSYFKIIKVAQTIADLEGSENIEKPYVAEALQYRRSEE